MATNRKTRHIPCKFFKQGHCNFGENCHYSHLEKDQRRLPAEGGFVNKGYKCSICPQAARVATWQHLQNHVNGRKHKQRVFQRYVCAIRLRNWATKYGGRSRILAILHRMATMTEAQQQNLNVSGKPMTSGPQLYVHVPFKKTEPVELYEGKPYFTETVLMTDERREYRHEIARVHAERRAANQHKTDDDDSSTRAATMPHSHSTASIMSIGSSVVSQSHGTRKPLIATTTIPVRNNSFQSVNESLTNSVSMLSISSMARSSSYGQSIHELEDDGYGTARRVGQYYIAFEEWTGCSTEKPEDRATTVSPRRRPPPGFEVATETRRNLGPIGSSRRVHDQTITPPLPEDEPFEIPVLPHFEESEEDIFKFQGIQDTLCF